METLECTVLSEEDGNKIENIVSYVDDSGINRAVREIAEGTKSQLGKRYKCGHSLGSKVVDGTLTSVDGKQIYFGCGTEILCTKAPTEPKKDEAMKYVPMVPHCCNMPMTIMEPRPLPSSD